MQRDGLYLQRRSRLPVQEVVEPFVGGDHFPKRQAVGSGRETGGVDLSAGASDRGKNYTLVQNAHA